MERSSVSSTHPVPSFISRRNGIGAFSLQTDHGKTFTHAAFQGFGSEPGKRVLLVMRNAQAQCRRQSRIDGKTGPGGSHCGQGGIQEGALRRC
jgi:hypothetical protein